MIWINKSHTPIRPQFQTTECGVAVLRTMFSHFGRDVATRDIRRASGVSRDCVSAGDLVRTARAFGFSCQARTLEPERLTGLALPVIVHLRFIHFVVLESIDANTAILNCPAGGRLALGRAEFDEAFTGVTLSLTPGETRAAPDRPPSPEPAWWRWFLAAHGPGAILALVLSSATGLGLAVMAYAVTGRTPLWSVWAGLGLAGVSAPAAALARRNSQDSAYLALRERLVEQLLSLPADFHVYRLPEVLRGLFQAARRQTGTASTRLLDALGGLLAAAMLLAAAVGLESGRGAVLAAGFCLWCGWVGFWSLHRRAEERAEGGGAVQFAPVGADALRNPAATKLGDGPDRLWRRLMAAQAAAQMVANLTAWPARALAFSPLLLGALGAATVLIGPAPPDLKIGVGLLVLAVALAAVAAPMTRLRGVIGGLRRDGFQWRDVFEEPCPDPPSPPPSRPENDALRLESVSFAFAPGRQPVVQDVSLMVRPGEQVGITGPSGGGKSTLSEIMAGWHEPLAGRVLSEGVSLHALEPEERARRVARVDRRCVLFEGTVRENLILWDPAVTDADLQAGVRDAGLGPVLAAREQGLDSRVEAFGRNFSGGQQQRLEIARALARNPKVLILDDAVDALDLLSERSIRAALRRRGCALVLISHRASSLAACDRVVKFADGRIGESLPKPALARAAASAIFAPPTAAAFAPPSGGGHEALLAAGDALTPVDGRAALEDLSGLSTRRAAGLMARSRGYRLRAVRFIDGDWWRQAAGDLLGFTREGAPIPLKDGMPPKGIDPANLIAEAFWLSPAGRGTAQTHGGWISRLAKPAIVRAAAHAALASSVALTALLVLGGASAATSPRRLLALTAIGCALLLLTGEAIVMAVRLEGDLRNRAAQALGDLLPRIDADVVRRWIWSDIARGLDAFDRLTEHLVQLMSLTLPAALVLVGVIAMTGQIAGERGLQILAAGAALVAATTGLRTLLGGRGDRRAAVLKTRADDRLAVILWGRERLDLLGATQRAFSHWRDLDDQQSSAERAKAAWGDIASGLEKLIMVALAAGLMLGARDLGQAVMLAALGWCGLFAIQNLIAAPAAIAADRTSWVAARRLLAAVERSGLTRADAGSSPITAEGLVVRYEGDRRPVLQQASLTIDPAEITAIAGGSGGGKSTLLRALLGLQALEAGEVRVGGRPLDQINLASWRQAIAAIFQGDQLETTVTIKAQLVLNGEADLVEIWDALTVVEMADEIQRMPMGLQTIVEAGGLSTGQQQRLLIARALLQRPRLLVMDEATNAIPDSLQATILRRLREREVGCLIVTHRETLVAAADRLHVVEDGRVVFSGAPEDWKAMASADPGEESVI